MATLRFNFTTALSSKNNNNNNNNNKKKKKKKMEKSGILQSAKNYWNNCLRFQQLSE